MRGIPHARLSLTAWIIALALVAFGCQIQKQDAHVPTAPLAALPKVKQIDDAGLQELLKPSGRPRLINFWATWCGPCREEFPDLVRIAASQKEKIDVVTVSWDEPAEIDAAVPQFLAEMGSDSPAYLLKSRDQDTAINSVSRDWSGALPFTVLINGQGETVYTHQGRFDPAVLIAEINKL